MTSRTHRRERDGVIMESNRKTPFIFVTILFLSVLGQKSLDSSAASR